MLISPKFLKIEEISFDFGEFRFRTYFAPSKLDALKSFGRNRNLESFDVVLKPSLKIKVLTEKLRSSSSTLAVHNQPLTGCESQQQAQLAAQNQLAAQQLAAANSTRSSKLNSQQQTKLAVANSTRSS